MKAITSEAKNQQVRNGRRGFMRKISATAGAVIVTAGAVAQVMSPFPANSGLAVVEAGDLTPQQRLLLSRFNAMSDTAQDFILNMAELNSSMFPREYPNVAVMLGGAA